MMMMMNDDDYRVEHSAGSSIGRCSHSPPWPQSVWRNASFSSVVSFFNHGFSFGWFCCCFCGFQFYVHISSCCFILLFLSVDLSESPLTFA